jgi:hypothetical protein
MVRTHHLPPPAKTARGLGFPPPRGPWCLVSSCVIVGQETSLHYGGYGQIADGIGTGGAVHRTACSGFRWPTVLGESPGRHQDRPGHARRRLPRHHLRHLYHRSARCSERCRRSSRSAYAYHVMGGPVGPEHGARQRGAVAPDRDHRPPRGVQDARPDARRPIPAGRLCAGRHPPAAGRRPGSRLRPRRPATGRRTTRCPPTGAAGRRSACSTGSSSR